MGKYKVEFTRSAKKEILDIPKNDIKKILARIDDVVKNPRGIGCEKLSGEKNKYRIRQGNYRIVYSIHDDILTVWVVKIAHRKEVYR